MEHRLVCRILNNNNSIVEFVCCHVVIVFKNWGKCGFKLVSCTITLQYSNNGPSGIAGAASDERSTDREHKPEGRRRRDEGQIG